jgi:hypothetical protein
MPKAFLLPDTNIFLHFPPLHEVDWCSVADASSVVIGIAPVIMRELNSHKDNPRSRKIRDRADAALKELQKQFKAQIPNQLRPNVEIQFLKKDPSIDFLSYGLVRELDDDWLIATAIDLANNSQVDRVAIVTADVGLEVKASSHVTVIEMPELLRLPEELNSDEKRIKDLECQLRKFQAASPELKLTFQSGSVFQALKFFDFPRLDDKTITSRLEQARTKYPKSKESTNRVSIKFSSSSDTQLFKPYNEQVDQYIATLEPYLVQMSKITDWYNQTAKVQLVVKNDGGAPGDDIDISVHFPDGFEVVDDDGLPAMPKEPRSPRSPGDMMKALSEMSLINSASMAGLHYSMPKGVENAQILGIKKTKSHEVKFHVKKLKHQGYVPLPDLYLHFSDAPRSFRADYRIIAGNVPTPIIGTLDFVWKPKLPQE